MADTFVFFKEMLPAKIAADPDLKTIGAVYQFEIEGAGVWALDLKGDGGVTEGAAAEADCVITVGKDDWEEIVDNPMLATQYFMMGRVKTTRLGLAIQLQKILA